MKKGKDILAILSEVLGPIVEEGQDVVRAVPGVDAVLLKEVAVPQDSLPEVPFAALLNVVFVD